MNNPEFNFGGFTVPAGCRRIYITAKLEPSNGDPRIQPTGFPDVGPVCYPDPNTDPTTTKGLICLVQSEPAMANLLEEVCLEDKYTGTLNADLGSLPYVKVTRDGTADGEFITASTIDGHRFASEYLMKAKYASEKDLDLVAYVIRELGASPAGDHVPAANVPLIFELAMELDPLSLIHGFQISIKNRLTFVGLRSPRALTACILGYRCEQRPVPGVRLDPIGTGDAGQAIFQKERIIAGEIEAKFSIDVGLLASLHLASVGRLKSAEKKATKDEVKAEVQNLQNARCQLLVALALWKVASLISGFKVERSLRTECKLRLKSNETVKYSCDGGEPKAAFDFDSIINAKSEAKPQQHALIDLVGAAKLPENRSPLTLKFGG